MNTMKTFFLMTLLTVLFVFIGRLVGGSHGMVFAFGFAVVMNFFSYWFSDKIVLSMYRAKPISEADNPQLYSMVRRLATAAHLPMPKIYETPQDTPNAFATGRNPEHAAVAVTSGLLKILDSSEVEGVIAHELSHVKHRDILIGTIAATFAGAIMMLSHIARFATFFGGGFGRDDDRGGGNALALLFVAIIAPIAALLIQLAISRSREYKADEGSAQITHNPDSLASALAKLHNMNARIPMQAQPATAHMFIMSPLSGKSMLSLFATHPPVEKRIERLRSLR